MMLASSKTTITSKERKGAKLIDANCNSKELIIEGWRDVICIFAYGMSANPEPANNHNKTRRHQK